MKELEPLEQELKRLHIRQNTILTGIHKTIANENWLTSNANTDSDSRINTNVVQPDNGFAIVDQVILVARVINQQIPYIRAELIPKNTVVTGKNTTDNITNKSPPRQSLAIRNPVLFFGTNVIATGEGVIIRVTHGNPGNIIIHPTRTIGRTERVSIGESVTRVAHRCTQL